MSTPVIVPLGAAALTIRLGEHPEVATAERAAVLAQRIRDAALADVIDVLPAVASVGVYVDPATDIGATRDALAVLLRAGDMASQPRVQATHTIPVRYDGADLDEVAARTELSRDDVIRLHAERTYHVLAIGFLPGFGYLGPLDAALSLPRRATPRTRVPAGSVAIAGVQTGIYPRESPGGWHILGTTDVALFDAARVPPSLFQTGDRVRFVASA